MSRLQRRPRPRSAPAFAVGLDGTLYLSVFEMDGVIDNADALERLDGERAFVGIAIGPGEGRRLFPHLLGAGREAAAFIVGARRHRPR